MSDSERRLDLVNCTPHEIVIFDQDGKTVMHRFPPSKYTVRVNKEPGRRALEYTKSLGIIPVTSKTVPGAFIGDLPEDKDVIVSLAVAEAGEYHLRDTFRGFFGNRRGVFIPDTGPEIKDPETRAKTGGVRDESGAIVGTYNLVRCSSSYW
jgi:hypothetical protein